MTSWLLFNYCSYAVTTQYRYALSHDSAIPHHEGRGGGDEAVRRRKTGRCQRVQGPWRRTLRHVNYDHQGVDRSAARRRQFASGVPLRRHFRLSWRSTVKFCWRRCFRTVVLVLVTLRGVCRPRWRGRSVHVAAATGHDVSGHDVTILVVVVVLWWTESKVARKLDDSIAWRRDFKQLQWPAQNTRSRNTDR